MDVGIFLDYLFFGLIFAVFFFIVCTLNYKKKLKFSKHWIKYLQLSSYIFGTYVSILISYCGGFIIIDETLGNILSFIGSVSMAVFVAFIIFKMQEIEGIVSQLKLECFIEDKIKEKSTEIEEKLSEQNQLISKINDTLEQISNNLNNVNTEISNLGTKVDDNSKDIISSLTTQADEHYKIVRKEIFGLMQQNTKLEKTSQRLIKSTQSIHRIAHSLHRNKVMKRRNK